jgi:hypothetical protein
VSQGAIDAECREAVEREGQAFPVQVGHWRRFGANRMGEVNAGEVEGRSLSANRGESNSPKERFRQRVSGKDGVADRLGEDVTKQAGRVAK